MSIVGASLSEPHIDIYVSLSSGIPREVHQGKASFVLHVSVLCMVFRERYTRGRLVSFM